MPAASTKPETKSSSEAMEPIKQAISLLDRKVRNLEKRKSKLDSYKEKANKGNQLEKDQEEAISHYTEVIQNLEFAKDLQKQYVTICVESEKTLKKQAKREKVERQLVEVKRFRELLQLQGMLDSLGSETVRSDFKTGKHGAVVLTEENLHQMDELYKLISPTREGEKDYQDQLTQAAEHVSSLLDGKEKEVVGTTYKELRELMDLINNCGYFENIQCYEETEPQEDATVEVPSTEVETKDVTEPVVIEDPQPILPPVVPSDPVTAAYTQPIEAEVLEGETPEHTAPLDQDYHAYTAASAAYNRQRPFQEIVSSVQGSFNFLQESEIDIESPHMDPAVVAMGPAPIPHPSTTPSDSPTLPAQTLLADPHLTPQSTQQPSPTPHHLDPSDPQKAMADYSNQNYNHAPANFGIDDPVSAHSTQNQTILSEAASAGLPDPAVAGIIPAHIPIPNQSNPLSQDELQAANQPEKKPFTMNANAAVFQSMYSQSGGAGGLEKPVSPQSAEYQSNYQGNNYRGGSGGNRGFRGGRGGRGGVSNGYSRGGSRGGSVNGRGGFNRDNRDGDRVPYQGYPPRSDYRPEGYQGYHNSGYYNKRGGPNRGGMRGGPRGGSGGGRGGSRSGYPRPMNQQQTINQ